MNLFIVHTPFQLLVAQGICEHIKLENNILVLAYSGLSGEKFYGVFEKLVIPTCWNRIFKCGNINVFSTVRSMFEKLPRLLFTIDEIINTNNVLAVYMGDINHPFYACITVRYSGKLTVSYFEEGLSHYAIQFPEYKMSSLSAFKHAFLELFLFKRLGVPGFSGYLYKRNVYGLNKKVNRIYSIISSKSRPGDYAVQLKLPAPGALAPYFSELNQKIGDNRPSKSVLFLSTTANSLFTGSLNKIEFLLLALKRLNIEKGVVFIKFHPKESTSSSQYMLERLRADNHIGVVILDSFPYPVELLFGNVRFDVIAAYDSSSLLYAKAMNVCDEIYSLTPLIVEYNEHNNIDASYPRSISKRFNAAYLDLFGTEMAAIE